MHTDARFDPRLFIACPRARGVYGPVPDFAGAGLYGSPC
jgi:hypothetical protein